MLSTLLPLGLKFEFRCVPPSAPLAAVEAPTALNAATNTDFNSENSASTAGPLATGTAASGSPTVTVPVAFTLGVTNSRLVDASICVTAGTQPSESGSSNPITAGRAGLPLINDTTTKAPVATCDLTPGVPYRTGTRVNSG